MLDRASAKYTIFELARELAPSLPSEEAGARKVHLQDAGLTSVAAVKLMLAIEAACDIVIPDEDLTPENFRSIAEIEALVARLRGA